MLRDDCFHLDYVHTRRRDRKLLWRRKLLCNQLLVDADHYQLLKRTRIVAVQLTVNVETVSRNPEVVPLSPPPLLSYEDIPLQRTMNNRLLCVA